MAERQTARGADDGFTLLEVVVASFILLVALTGLAGVGTSAMVMTGRAKMRETAVAEANRQIEALRSSGYGRLRMNPGVSPGFTTAAPTTYRADDGLTYTTLRATAAECADPRACLWYQQKVSVGQFAYEVRTIVSAVDDPSDGTGLADADSRTIDLVRAWVSVSPVSPIGAPFLYNVQTDLQDHQNDPVTEVQGLRARIVAVNATADTDASGDPIGNGDYVDGMGNRVADESQALWLDGLVVEVEPGPVAGDEIDDGGYQNFGLPPNAGYTCIVRNGPDTLSWHPYGEPTANSLSSPCGFSAGVITTFTQRWAQYSCQFVSGGVGNMEVAVVDSVTGAPVSGATVSLAFADGQAAAGAALPASSTTDAYGNASWNGITTGHYTVSATKSGYNAVPAPGDAAVNLCVFADADDVAKTALMATPASAVLPPSATVQVKIMQGGPGTYTFRTLLRPTSGGPDVTTSDQSVDHNAVTSFTLRPPTGTYNLLVFCVGSTGAANQKFAKNTQSYTAGSTFFFPTDTTKSQKVNCP